MNPWLIVGAVVAWSASVGGAFFYGQGVGKDAEVARQADVQQAIRDTREAAQQGAAEAISKIKITNTTIRGEVQREIQTNTVYRDCRLPADGLRIANEALAGQQQGKPAGGGKLPGKPGRTE